MSHSFMDIHQHILYDMDDGPRTLESSFLQLRAASADGIAHIIATPHVTPGRDPFDLPAYHYKLKVLNTLCRERGLLVTVHPGAEILYTEETLRCLQAGMVPTLVNSRYVLLEFLPQASFDRLYTAARKLANAGFVPIFAHVERYEALMKDIKRVDDLRNELNVRIQVNCSTILQPRGLRMRRLLRSLLENGCVDYVATDAHNRTTRPINMGLCYQELERLYGRKTAIALTGANQQEIFM